MNFCEGSRVEGKLAFLDGDAGLAGLARIPRWF